MKTFDFYRDQKCSVWTRTSFRIEAETYEQAVAKVLEMEENDDYDEVDTDYEVLYETTTELTPDVNDNFSTTEIYSHRNIFGHSSDIIFENGQSIKIKTL